MLHFKATSDLTVKTRQKIRKVLVVLWLAGSAGRKQMTGILNYVKNGHPWSINLITDPAEFDEAAIRKEAIAILLDPDEEIGRCGADYFLKLGNYASFGFIPDAANRGWSRLRERGFKQALEEKNIPCTVYNSSIGNIGDWLTTLPKPTAIMVAYDIKAKEALEECRKAHLDIPRRLLDRRFRQIVGRSVLDVIQDKRLESVCTLLRTTELPISEICASCSFGSGTYPLRLFKAKMGMTMRTYRMKTQENPRG